MIDLSENELTASDIRKYKTGWKNQHKEVTYTDELSKEENALFKDDPEFEGYILDVKNAESQVYRYMDMKIAEYRNGLVEKIAQIKPIKAAEFKDTF
jgi:hypothetical protein